MKATWGLALVLGLGSSAAPGEVVPHPRQLVFREREFHLPRWQSVRNELSNGTPVYVVEDHSLPLVDVAVAVRTGAWIDPEGQTGLASFTGAMIRRCGVGASSPEAFDERVDRLAIELDTGSGLTRAGASLGSPTWSFDEGLELLFEMIARPGFESSRLADARANIGESFRRRNDDPLTVLGREWGWLLYGRRHYAHRPLTIEGLDTMDENALRACHRESWRPEQMVIAVSGDVSTEPLLASLNAAFAAWPVSAGAGDVSTVPPAPPVPTTEPGVYHVEHSARQALVMLGHRTPRESQVPEADRMPLVVLAELMGGSGAISRLGGRLRTGEGLVYTVESALDIGWFEGGALRIQFSTRPDAVDRAVSVAIEELERLRREPPHPLELEIVVAHLQTQLLLRFDTAEEIAGLFAEDELIGRPHEYWSTYRDRLRRVTPDDVRRVASRYLHPEELVIVAVGPWDVAGASLRRLSGQRAVRRLPARDPLTLEPLATGGETPEREP